VRGDLDQRPFSIEDPASAAQPELAPNPWTWPVVLRKTGHAWNIV
jgi:hypothetical protein